MTSWVEHFFIIVAYRWRSWICQAGGRICHGSAVDLPAGSAADLPWICRQDLPRICRGSAGRPCHADSAGRSVAECGRRLHRSCRQILPPDLVIRVRINYIVLTHIMSQIIEFPINLVENKYILLLIPNP